MTLFEELKWRGLIKDMSSPDLEKKLNEEKLTFYLGTDPTAPSLHVGHLASFITAKRLKDAGHKCILLVGGATGRIGDPRPSSERTIIDIDVLNKNLRKLKDQVKIFGCDEVVDNYEWSKDINFVDFLRDYGKHFPVGYMLGKDVVRRRLEIGITYTEFSYMIMQALDYMWLYQNKGVTLQIGGSDQWGNITAGVDLIRKKLGESVYAFCMPLVLDSNGNKIGKSEGNAVWIDKELVSSYKIYQYFVNTNDLLVIDYLKYFTFLNKEEIERLEEFHKKEPEKRIAGKTLAYEVVKFLHGKEEAEKAKKISEEIYENGDFSQNVPTIELNSSSITENFNILDLLISIKVVSSKSEARRLVEQGGIKINENIINSSDRKITNDDFKNNYLVVSKGKKNHYKIEIK